MKKRYGIITLFILVVAYLCRPSHDKYVKNESNRPIALDVKSVKEPLIQPGSSQINDANYKKSVVLVERLFWRNLKGNDRDMGMHNAAKLQKFFKQKHLTPYQFYIELTELEKRSVVQAKQEAIALGYKDRDYTRYVADYRNTHMSVLMTRHRISKELIDKFRGYYCICYLDRGASCINDHCLLPNYEYWR